MINVDYLFKLIANRQAVVYQRAFASTRYASNNVKRLLRKGKGLVVDIVPFVDMDFEETVNLKGFIIG